VSTAEAHRSPLIAAIEETLMSARPTSETDLATITAAIRQHGVGALIREASRDAEAVMRAAVGVPVCGATLRSILAACARLSATGGAR
jgi:hypothetical protein